jgi:hypothetical protein
MDGLPGLDRAVLDPLRHTGSARDSAHTSHRGVGWARPTRAVQMHTEVGVEVQPILRCRVHMLWWGGRCPRERRNREKSLERGMDQASHGKGGRDACCLAVDMRAAV